MNDKIRMTKSIAVVLRAFFDQPERGFYGFEIRERAERFTGERFSPGKLYPILQRLVEAGYLQRRIDAEPARATWGVGVRRGRPARHRYWMTPEGAERAEAELARLRTAISD